MNAFRVVTFAAMLTAASAIAQTTAQPAEPPVQPPVDPSTPQQRTMDLPEFRTLDINGDAQLSKDEARANTVVTKHFDELDTDKNGALSQEEYAKAKSLTKQPAPSREQ